LASKTLFVRSIAHELRNNVSIRAEGNLKRPQRRRQQPERLPLWQLVKRQCFKQGYRCTDCHLELSARIQLAMPVDPGDANPAAAGKRPADQLRGRSSRA
jgi:hypothetical protein